MNLLKKYNKIPGKTIVNKMSKELIELHDKILLEEVMPVSHAELARQIRIDELKRK